MNKMLEGVKEAAIVAQCDHDLTILPPLRLGAHPMFDRFHCFKCKATLYIPKRPLHS
jgi:hypothetical protein